MVSTFAFTCTHCYEVLSPPLLVRHSPVSSPLLSVRTLRRTPAPKVLVVTAGPSAEVPTSCKPR